MSKRTATTTPARNSKRTKSGDLGKEDERHESQLQQLVEDFVALYTTRKTGEVFKHSALKEMLQKVLVTTIPPKSGVITKVLKRKYDALASYKSLKDVSGDLYTVRIEGNHDMAIHGIALKPFPTPTQKKSEGFARLKLVVEDLDSMDMVKMYKASAQASTSETHPKKKAVAAVAAMQHVVVGVHDQETGRYYSVIVENGFTKLVTATLEGVQVAYTFYRDRPSDQCEPGEYSGSLVVPPPHFVDSSRNLQVTVLSGLTRIDVPITPPPTKQAATTVIQTSWSAIMPQNLEATPKPEPASEDSEDSEDTPNEDAPVSFLSDLSG